MRLAPEFISRYSELKHDVENSSYATFTDNLRRWFQFFESVPALRRALESLVAETDFDGWYQSQVASKGSWVGSGRLKWPEDGKKRLGLQIGLFKSFASEEIAVHQFALTFTASHNKFDEMTSTLADQYFRPFSSDLLQYLKAVDLEPIVVPAADRIVTLDHNSATYKDVIKSLEKLKTIIEQANNYSDEEDKEQRIGEIKAGRELLKTKRTRLKSLAAVLGTVLIYLVTKFGDSIIGEVATKIIDLLTELIGTGWIG